MAKSEKLTKLEQRLDNVDTAIDNLILQPAKETTIADHRVVRRDLEELRCWRRSLIRQYNTQLLKDVKDALMDEAEAESLKRELDPLFGRKVLILGDTALPRG